MAACAAIAALLVTREDAAPGTEDRPRPSSTRTGSVVDRSSSAPIPIDRPPTAYEVTYDVEDWAGGERVRSTDRLTVQRPYQGRLETRKVGASPTSEPQSRTTTDFGRVSIGSASAQPLLVETPPSLAASDLRLDAVLADAVEAGLVVGRERRRVGQANCQVYRSHDPFASGTFGHEPATRTHYTDTCIAASGLVLEELWVTDGRILRRRLASKVDASATVADDEFAAFGRHLEAREGGGSIRRADPTTRPAGAAFWEGLTVPAGFSARGRFAVVPPQRTEADQSEGETSVLPAASPRKRVGAVSDVWERGIDVLVLEQGGTVDGTSIFPAEPEGAKTIDVPGLGTGTVVLDARFSEIRFQLPRGRYVRILGTLPVAALQAAAASLSDVGPGTGLVYLDPLPE